MKYVVEVIETLKYDVIVEADSPMEAKKKAEAAYVRGDIVLSDKNYSDGDVECYGEADSDDLANYPMLEEEKDRG